MAKDREKQWMGKLAERPSVRLLVQGLLGCGCPKTVFDHYQIRHRVSGGTSLVELVLGERLLVRIIDAHDMDQGLDPSVSQWLNDGRAERDRRGLNRFRLVLMGRFSAARTRELVTLPQSLGPNLHLHILQDLDVDSVSRSSAAL
jgi:hypothetical protein